MVYALPTELGEFIDTMHILVSDNPIPYSYRFRCEGVKPSISLSSTEIDFNKFLLNHQLTRSITVENTCKLPVKV